MISDPYTTSASWASAPSKTLMNAFAQVGLPVPVTPGPRRASIEIQWVDAMGKCSNVYAVGAYVDIMQLVRVVDGVGRLHYVIHTESVIGSMGSIPTQLI